MTPSYRMYMLCVVLCTVHSVHCYSVTGTIQYNNGAVQKVKVLNYVSGENSINTRALTLDRLENAQTLPTLTIANFQTINKLELLNIALEHVPVFVNTSCSSITMTGNQIQSVPANAFSELRPSRLYLNNNGIQSMADRSVNMAASYVYLSCNILRHFLPSWFEDPSSIVSLALDGNQIEYIQDQAFNQMTNLKVVYLGNNHITSIGNSAFSSVIQILGLQFNDIDQLTADMFAARDERMIHLYLHHNHLSFLPEAVLVKLKPKNISLVGNPWQCRCLQDIERWLRELNSTRHDIPSRRGEPVCVVPVSFQNKCIELVDKYFQQTYAMGLSPVPECLATPCKSCTSAEDLYLTRLIILRHF